MPFDLKSGPRKFQLTMDDILFLVNWQFALVYLHDIVRVLKYPDKRLDYLPQALTSLHDARVALKLNKQGFSTTCIECLGHMVKHGPIDASLLSIHLTPSRQGPSNISKIRSFCSLPDVIWEARITFCTCCSTAKEQAIKGTARCQPKIIQRGTWHISYATGEAYFHAGDRPSMIVGNISTGHKPV